MNMTIKQLKSANKKAKKKGIVKVTNGCTMMYFHTLEEYGLVIFMYCGTTLVICEGREIEDEGSAG